MIGLDQISFSDPERARRVVESLAGQGVTDDDVAAIMPHLVEALKASPDPDRALINFERWTNAVTSRITHFRLLAEHPAALEIFFNVCGVSQLFSDILIRNPEYFEVLANPGVRGGARSAVSMYRELSGFVDSIGRPELKLEAMRRFKQRELLRIGTRDILGLADLPATALEFSNLADVCVQKVYELGVAELGSTTPFAVIGMGKLGGRELNYSSDIDLMFVIADSMDNLDSRLRGNDDKSAHKLAEFVTNGLSRNMQNGHLFRVDMRLRPEGRFGALVRTLSSYRAYYESWAEPWERQALIKARFIAGDAQLGHAFEEMIVPYVYQRTVTSEFLESIRRNKSRMEKKAEVEGKRERNVKLGYGGIRDIEFTVQLLQLELGGRDPHVRTPNTLDALGRLERAGVLDQIEADELADDYSFLRTVEHRLQILYELQTQMVPADPDERRLLARRLGYPDAASFDADYSRRTGRVRGHFEKLFPAGRREESSDRWSALFVADSAGAQTEVINRLREAGFRDAERAYATVRATLSGSDYGRPVPGTVRGVTGLIPRLISASIQTGDPDSSLQAIETLAAGYPNPVEFYRMLREAEGLLDRLCRLGAGSPPLVQSLSRHPEWLDLLVSEEIIDPEPKSVGTLRDELSERLPQLGEPFDAIALFVQRERLRIGARELWGETGASTACLELTALADAVLLALLEHASLEALSRYPDAAPSVESAALVGLGKLGGRELSYGSDWDFLVVYESETGRAVMESIVESMLSAGQALQTRGAPVTLDARLRPEGRFGALARTVEECRDYYLNSALTWEKQVLTKARPIGGNPDTGSAYMRAVEAAIYSAPLSDDARKEIQEMKRRIESERLKLDERDTDIKLGHGGLSDIEFTAQLYQLIHGAEHPEVRSLRTIDSLHALSRIHAIPAADAGRLSDAYSFLTALRNRLTLLTGIGTDALPTDKTRLRAVAVGMQARHWQPGSPGSDPEDRLIQQLRDAMQETRQIVDRLFYRPLKRKAGA